MIKKLLLICLIFFCFGCSNGKVVSVKKSNGDSLTYKFFKNFDSKKYYVYFFDRNTVANDDTKIIFGRLDDKYYYRIEGITSQTIIQKDGLKYTINDSGFFKEEGSFLDYSKGILPSDMDKLKTSGYETGKEKVFDSIFVFERFKNNKEYTTYYFKGNKLIYVRYSGIQNEILLRFNKFDKISDKIFEIDDSLVEFSY